MACPLSVLSVVTLIFNNIYIWDWNEKHINCGWDKMVWQPLTELFRFLLVETRRWNIRAGSVSFSLSDDSSMAVVTALRIALVASFDIGDGVREDEPIDGIDNGDLLAIIFLVYGRNLFRQFNRTFLYYYQIRCWLQFGLPFFANRFNSICSARSRAPHYAILTPIYIHFINLVI